MNDIQICSRIKKDEVVNIFTKLKDAVEVDAYITKVAEDTGISREAIASKYREKISKGSYKRIPTKNEYQKKVEQRKRETTNDNKQLARS